MSKLCVTRRLARRKKIAAFITSAALCTGALVSECAFAEEPVRIAATDEVAGEDTEDTSGQEVENANMTELSELSEQGGETLPSVNGTVTDTLPEAPVESENVSGTQTAASGTDVRDSIIRVTTGYEFEDDGSFDEWTGGFGFLITKDCLLIPKNIVIIDPDSILYRDIKSSARGKAYKDKFGIDLGDYEKVSKNIHTYLYADNGQKVEATVNTAAGGDSFAILSLSSRINSRIPVEFSNRTLEKEDPVYAVGTLSEKPAPAKQEFFGRLSSVTDKRKKGNSTYIDFEGSFTDLAGGCPLVDINQKVVGLITDGAGGRGTAVDIKTIEAALDKANIEYYMTGADGVTKKDSVSKNELIALVNQAVSIDRAIYTPESLKVLDEAVNEAKAVMNDPDASKNRVTKVSVPLEKAISSLTKIDNRPKYIRLCVIAAIVLILIVAVIVVLRNMKKPKLEDWEKEEAKEKKKAARQKGKNRKLKDTEPDDGWQQKAHDRTDSERRKEDDDDEDDGDGETGVLNKKDGDEDTGVLNRGGAVAFLSNTDNGRMITVNKDAFVIGKSASDSDYRIKGNTSVSRKHCRVLRRGTNFFIEDLGSTNGTYVDGEKVEPGDQEPLFDGQEIMIADEKYIFTTTRP